MIYLQVLLITVRLKVIELLKLKDRPVLLVSSPVKNRGKQDYFFMGNCRNVRGLGKSMVVFCLYEKLRYSNERSTIF